MFENDRARFRQELDDIRAAGLWKEERVLQSAQGQFVRTNGKDVMVRSQNALTGQVSNPKPELIENLQRQRGVTTATVAARLDRAKAIDLTLED